MNATEKKYVEKLKEYIHHLRINGSYDYKWNVFEFEISALEQQIKEPEDELRERKTSNTGRGHGNNFCPENCD